MHNIISNSLTHSSRYVNNSFELHRSLSNKTIHKDDILLSLGATSLFTNIPLDLAVQSITKRWIDIEKNTCIPFEEFISTISSTVFGRFVYLTVIRTIIDFRTHQRTQYPIVSRYPDICYYY